MSSRSHREPSLDRRIEELSPEKRALYERLASSSGDPARRVAPIERRGVASPAPLSFAQQRLWVLDQLMPGMPLFNLSGAIRIAEAFDETILERSINELVRRHESLRTTFKAVNGEPVQEILPELHIPLRTIDLSSLPEDDCDAEARRLLAEEGEAPFELATGPLLRTLLVRTSNTESVFHVVTHHIISDAWSIDIFWNELSAIWAAFEAGEPSPLPELPLQYADFAVWERDRLRGPILAELVSYWKNRLAGLPVMELRTDWPRPAVPSGRGSIHYAIVPAPVVRRLRALGRREGATLFMVLLAAFETLLARYTGEDDVVVGTFTANRDRAEIEGLIGFFVNALVLRADLSGRPTFRELLRQVRTTALDAYSHQEMPFARLIHELSPERDLSRNPLFQVAFQLLNTPGMLEEEEEDLDTGDDTVDLQRTTAVLDLTCTIREVGEHVEAELEYNTDLFRAETIERMAAHYTALLEAIARDPDREVHELPLVGAAARRRIVEEWNRTAVAYEGGGLVSLFEEQVSLRPDAEAVLFDGGVMTYAELDEHASRLAAQLLVHGAGEEVAVGVSLDRSPELVVALLAVLKAGGVYVPLDPRDPRERLERIVEDAGIDADRLAASPGRKAAGDRTRRPHRCSGCAVEPGRPCPLPGDAPRRTRMRDLHLRVDRKTQGRRDRAASAAQPAPLDVAHVSVLRRRGCMPEDRCGVRRLALGAARPAPAGRPDRDRAARSRHGIPTPWSRSSAGEQGDADPPRAVVAALAPRAPRRPRAALARPDPLARERRGAAGGTCEAVRGPASARGALQRLRGVGSMGCDVLRPSGRGRARRTRADRPSDREHARVRPRRATRAGAARHPR